MSCFGKIPSCLSYATHADNSGKTVPKEEIKCLKPEGFQHTCPLCSLIFSVTPPPLHPFSQTLSPLTAAKAYWRLSTYFSLNPHPSRFSLGQVAGHMQLWMLVSYALDAGPWVSSWAASISLQPMAYSITPFTGTVEGPQGGCHIQGTVPEWDDDDAEDSPWPKMVLPWGFRPGAQGKRSTAPSPDGDALTAELSLGCTHILRQAHLPARASSDVVFCLTLTAWCPGPQTRWDPSSGEYLINPAWPASSQSLPLLQGTRLHGSSLPNHRPRLSGSFPASVSSETGHHMAWYLLLVFLSCSALRDNKFCPWCLKWDRRWYYFSFLWDLGGIMGVINSHLLDEDNRNVEAETVLILCKIYYPRILEIEDSDMIGLFRWLPVKYNLY